MASTLVFQPTNFQSQSPLFGTLPGEIRNEIFAYALMQYEDDAAAYPEDSYWYRPGFSGPRKAHSALLQTCKAVYTEGQKVFLRDLEWAFWFNRGPDERTGNNACLRFFRNLSQQAAQSLEKVRFFTQMYWLEDGHGLRSIFSERQFRPSELTITIRYSDWWWWETNAPLKMKEDWLATFLGTPGLRQLRVEYETLSWKKEEMMRIVERNKKWKLPVRSNVDQGESDGYLSAEKTALLEWTWKGTSKLGGRTWSHHGKGEVGNGMVEYVVVTDTWKFVQGSLDEEELRQRGVFQEESNTGFWADDNRSDEDEDEDDEDDEEDYDEGSDYEEASDEEAYETDEEHQN